MNEPRKGKPKAIAIDMRPDAEYWQALGEFIEAFAGTEVSLFAYLTHTAGLAPSVAKALFGRAHALDYVESIRRIWRVARPSPDIETELSEAFTRFKAINDTRNVIIHQPSFSRTSHHARVTDDGNVRLTEDGHTRVTESETTRVSSNIARALLPEPPTLIERQVSPDIVRAMTADLHRIGQVVVAFMLYPNGSFEERADAFPTLRNEWRYTPPPSHQT